LSKNRADTYRRNSDALALDRAGVKRGRPEEMVRLREAEVAADAAIRDLQRELRDIEAEIKLRPRPRLGAKWSAQLAQIRAAWPAARVSPRRQTSPAAGREAP